MANFPTKPTLSQGESPSLFDRTQEENVTKAEMDGGYLFKRRRYTRRPRYMFKTGFIGINNADKEILEQFWDDHQMDTTFNYYDYIHGETRTVSFAKPVSFMYEGVGQTKLWNVKIEMEEI